MIFTQVIVTAFISSQWIIMYTYYFIPVNGVRTSEQSAIISFVYTLTNYCFYLNNVKSFYLSMLTSRLFRKTFIKTLIKLLPRRLRQRCQVSQADTSMMTIVHPNRQHIKNRGMTTAC